MIVETTVADKFKGIVFQFFENEIFIQSETKQLTRPNGVVQNVTMSRWHWWVLTWITKKLRHPHRDVLNSVEEILTDHPYDQALQWWLECYYDSWCQLEEEGRVASS